MAHQNQMFTESSNSETFKCAEQKKLVCDETRSFYQKKTLFDVVLIAEMDNIQVHAHKIVLSASSEYFEGILQGDVKEVKLKEIDGEILASIVDFMYMASIELRDETVKGVLRASDHFQMYNLKALCSNFMVKRLNACNCLSIARFAEYNDTELNEKATAFALKHFETVCREKEFLELSKEQLSALVSSDDLRISSEEKVFLSLVTWVEYDKENREPVIVDIFSLVRFTQLKPKFIIKNRHSICKTIASDELIFSWLEWHLSGESRTRYPRASVKTRKNEKLVFTSGFATSDLKVQIFDRDSNTWSIPDLPCPSRKRMDYRSIAINEKLIVAGGIIGGFETNTVECYDFETKKWTDLPPMGSAHRLPGMVELDGELYVVGGRNNREWSCLVEKYDFAAGKWKEVAPLLTPFANVQVAALDGLLYVVGKDESTMECYDPDINQWTEKPFKNEKSTCFGFAAVGGYLYAVGGWYEGRDSKTVERYHPSTETWTNVNSLKLGQCYMKCAALNNRLIACKGQHDDKYTDIVEEYNPETSEWTTLAPFFPHELKWWTSSLFSICNMK